MDEKKLQTAIMRNVKIGMGDRGYVTLRFDAYISEGTAALQVISKWEDMEKILKTVDDVRQLEGKPCWVDSSRPGISVFEKMWNR